MKVLFVGNSHTYFNDMPQLFAEMYRQITGTAADVTMLAYSGRDLKWHNDEYFSLRFALMYGNYDCCVFQQQAHPFPETETTVVNAEKIIELCRKCKVNPVIYMTWAEKNRSEEAPQRNSFYRQLAQQQQVLLAPVGEVFADLQLTHPEIELFFRDGEHASPYGDYLIAATFAGLFAGKQALDKLDNRGKDFRVSFEAGVLSACCDPQTVSVALEKEQTSVIIEAVKRHLD